MEAQLAEIEALKTFLNASHKPTRYVDFNHIDTIDELRRENPTDYRTIRKIITVLDGQPLPRKRGWMEASYRVRDVHYDSLLMTSLPPKKHVYITLDDTTYHAIVTLAGGRPVLIPAKR